AATGQAAKAFEQFNVSCEHAHGFRDGYYAISVYCDHAMWAIALGRLDIAHRCYRRALSFARERHIDWRIPYITFSLARVSIKMGNYEHARSLFLDGLTHYTETPVLRVLRSTIALELSDILRDDSHAQRAFDRNAVELALRS